MRRPQLRRGCRGDAPPGGGTGGVGGGMADARRRPHAPRCTPRSRPPRGHAPGRAAACGGDGQHDRAHRLLRLGCGTRAPCLGPRCAALAAHLRRASPAGLLTGSTPALQVLPPTLTTEWARCASGRVGSACRGPSGTLMSATRSSPSRTSCRQAACSRARPGWLVLLSAAGWRVSDGRRRRLPARRHESHCLRPSVPP